MSGRIFTILVTLGLTAACSKSTKVNVGEDGPTGSGTAGQSSNGGATGDGGSATGTGGSDSSAGGADTGAGGLGGSVAGGGAGAPPMCNAATGACVDPAPSGWTGPVVVREAPGDGTPPTCEGDYPTEEAVAFAGLNATTDTCECECGPAEDFTCGAVTVRRSAVSCFALGADAPVFRTAAEGCQNFTEPDADSHYSYTTVPATGGSCEASVATFEKEAPSWDTAAVICSGGTPVGTCGDGQLCVPRSPVGFQDTICVYKKGDFACPADMGFPVKRPYHETTTDDRACQCGQCGAPTGTCDVTVRLADFSCPTGVTVPLDPEYVDLGCPDPSFVPRSFYLTTASDQTEQITCAAPDGAVVGNVDPASPITVCCTD